MAPSDADGRGPRATRRGVLAGGVAALAGATGAVGRSSAQITQTAVIPEPDSWEGENLAGFMIHLGGDVTPTNAGDLPACDLANWPPDEAYEYDATIINRKDAQTPEEQTTLLVDRDVNMTRGELFIINTFTRCETDYVGVDLERIGRRFRGTASGPHVNIEDDQRPDEGTPGEGGGTGQFGPGFDAVSAVLAAAGLGGLLAWRRAGEE